MGEGKREEEMGTVGPEGNIKASRVVEGNLGGHSRKGKEVVAEGRGKERSN